MESTTQHQMIKPQSLITEDAVKLVVLKDKGINAQLHSWKLVNFTKAGDNFGSFITSVEVKYNLHNELCDVSYVAKVNPCSSYANIGDLSNALFTKEGKFYTDLVPNLNAVLEEAGKEPLHAPKCFHVVLEKGKEQIYFEDLRAKGFKMLEKTKGLSQEHTNLIIQELARLHAASYLLQAKSPDESLEQKYNFLGIDFRTYTENCEEILLQANQGHLTNASGILKKFKGYEKAASWVEGLKPELYNLLTSGMKSDKFNSVCHGDCWNNNVVFRYSEDGQPQEVMFLDLQCCSFSSLAVDLNYLLFTSLSGDTRKPNLMHFLSSYFTTYKEVLESRGLPMYFSEEELLTEFNSKNAIGAFFGMRVVPGILMDPSELPDISRKGIDMEKLMQEFREKTMAMIGENPLAKPRFLAIFDDLTENGLIS